MHFVHVFRFKENRQRFTKMHAVPENKENLLTSLGVKYLSRCSLSDFLSLFVGCTFKLSY